MSDTLLTITGNLTGDPELRFTQSGHAVVSFTIASTPRKFNRSTNEWEDGAPLFMRCSAWRELAENLTESLAKGSAVIAQGKLGQRDYETREGEKRTVIELLVEEIGPSLRNAVAQVTKRKKGDPAPNRGGFTAAPQQQGDAWSTQPPAQQGNWGAPQQQQQAAPPQMPTAGQGGWTQGPHPDSWGAPNPSAI